MVTGFWPAGKPLQVNEVFSVVDNAIKFTEVLSQVKLFTDPIERFGVVASRTTVIESFLVLPVLLLVAVTMYLPGADTTTGF
jgi:hypothetical protein